MEHWANALHGGPAAARSMLGQDVTYDRVPYFYTDQYDLGMEYSGYVGPGGYDQVVYRGDRGRPEFIAFWLPTGRVLAGMNVNVWDVTRRHPGPDSFRSARRPRRARGPGRPAREAAHIGGRPSMTTSPNRRIVGGSAFLPSRRIVGGS